jgi:hypothetical protein
MLSNAPAAFLLTPIDDFHSLFCDNFSFDYVQQQVIKGRDELLVYVMEEKRVVAPE